MTKPRVNKINTTTETIKVFHLDGKWGNLCIAYEKIGHPFSTNVDATIDNFRCMTSPCEIIIKNHEFASGKLWRSLRDNDIDSDHVKITLA